MPSRYTNADGVEYVMTTLYIEMASASWLHLNTVSHSMAIPDARPTRQAFINDALREKIARYKAAHEQIERYDAAMQSQAERSAEGK